jgi:hypothetical protein
MKPNSIGVNIKVARFMHYLVVSIIVALALTGCSKSDDKNLAAAEIFVDAFYSFNAQKLEATLSHAEDSIPSMVFYQGWADGGNYQVVNRMPCKSESAESVSCSIAVKDDHMGALGIDFDVTDTFHLSVSEGRIISVRNSSNDLQVYLDAEKWVRRKRPELIREPCRGFSDGGPTPGKCAQAMVRGYAEFAASDDFPELR